MSDAPEESADRPGSEREGTDPSDSDRSEPEWPHADGSGTSQQGTDRSDGTDELEDLRREVEEKYDFDNFGPADMAEMSVDEWEAAFDPETWITGEALLDRVEKDLSSRVASREVFARVERERDPARLLAYSDEGYAIVYPDGSVAGEGTVLRDVKPSVALCSMESYDVPEPPADASLPEPEDVPEQSGELGNLMLQVIAGIQVIAALILFGAGVFAFGEGGANAWLFFAASFGFLAVGVLLFFTVANARLSDAFRAEEYRNRLRAVGSAADGRPAHLSNDGPNGGGEASSRTGSTDAGSRGTGGSGTGDDDGDETGGASENGRTEYR